MKRTAKKDPTTSSGARRALARCALAMCFERRIEAPPALCDAAMQLGIPAASVRRLERLGLITQQAGSWQLTSAGAKTLGVRAPRQIVRRR